MQTAEKDVLLVGAREIARELGWRMPDGSWNTRRVYHVGEKRPPYREQAGYRPKYQSVTAVAEPVWRKTNIEARLAFTRQKNLPPTVDPQGATSERGPP